MDLAESSLLVKPMIEGVECKDKISRIVSQGNVLRRALSILDPIRTEMIQRTFSRNFDHPRNGINPDEFPTTDF